MPFSCMSPELNEYILSPFNLCQFVSLNSHSVLFSITKKKREKKKEREKEGKKKNTTWRAYLCPSYHNHCITE